jgi:hypothetical protein
MEKQEAETILVINKIGEVFPKRVFVFFVHFVAQLLFFKFMIANQTFFGAPF